MNTHVCLLDGWLVGPCVGLSVIISFKKAGKLHLQHSYSIRFNPGLGIYKRKNENTQERKHARVHENTQTCTKTRTRTRKRPRKKGLAQEETIMGKKVTKNKQCA